MCARPASGARDTQFLRAQGYDRARNVEGGTIAWTKRGLPVVAGA
jgi:rhodanese-related sulfurtransferase